jgi:predicted TIM-barrel fold metal-dependent hydrolase
MRLSLQPVDAPDDPKHVLQLIDQLGSEDLLMFSTDYPHWHFAEPEQALPVGLSPGLRRKILRDNARTFYQL